MNIRIGKGELGHGTTKGDHLIKVAIEEGDGRARAGSNSWDLAGDDFDQLVETLGIDDAFGGMGANTRREDDVFMPFDSGQWVRRLAHHTLDGTLIVSEHMAYLNERMDVFRELHAGSEPDASAFGEWLCAWVLWAFEHSDTPMVVIER